MERISQMQLFILFAIYIYATVLGGPIIAAARYDSALALSLGSLGGLVITYAAVSLARKRPKEFFASYGREIVGKFLHIPLMVLIIFFFLLVSSIDIRGFQDTIELYYLPNTPVWVISGLIGICVALAVRSGIEAIFRCAQVLFLFTAAIILIKPFLLGTEIKRDIAIAFLTNHDLKALGSASLSIILWYGEMIMVLFFFPYLAEPNKTMRSIRWATLVGTIFLMLDWVLSILVFGANLAGHMDYPVLQVTRYINIADFLENLDPYYMAISVTMIFLSVSISLYVAVLCSAQILSLKDYRPLSFSMTAIMVGISFHITENVTDLAQFMKQVFTPFALFVECIPIFYLIIGWVRSRKGKYI